MPKSMIYFFNLLLNDLFIIHLDQQSQSAGETISKALKQENSNDW